MATAGHRAGDGRDGKALTAAEKGKGAGKPVARPLRRGESRRLANSISPTMLLRRDIELDLARLRLRALIGEMSAGRLRR